MAKAKKKTVVKSASVDKSIAVAVNSLMSVCDVSSGAVASRADDAKKFTAESKRLVKKKTALAKRKKMTAAKLKKDSSAANRKMLKDIDKELTLITKAGAKNRAEKTANSEELSGLQMGFKKASTYMKAIEKADKILNKPKKKKKKVKRAKIKS